jgi:hypothetical protein
MLKSRGKFVVIGMFFLISLFLITVVGAATNIPPVAQEDCIVLRQSCTNCTYCNVSQMISQGSTDILFYEGVAMTQSGSDFNYTFCNTSTLGTYTYNTKCGNSTNHITTPNSFEVTVSGAAKISEGEGSTLFAVLLFFILSVIFFTVLGVKVEAFPFKIIFFGIAGIFLFMGILYSMVIVTQIFGQYNDFISGFAAIVVVGKVILGIAILTLCLYSLYIAFRMWRFKKWGY